MTTRAKVSKSALAEQFRAFIDPDFVITDDETLRPYECDGLAMYREMPMLVVLPETVEQVQRVMRLCQRSEEHTSKLQSRPHLVCRLLLEKKKRQHMSLS